jgi:cyclic pyranopterin phosphate synthase
VTSRRIIPLRTDRSRSAAQPADAEGSPAKAGGDGAPGAAGNTAAPPIDRLGRPLRDLRISVTDRCNFRCTYCMPREIFDARHEYVAHAQVLRFEEIVRLAGVFVLLGVRKIRLTGGEPLLRRDLPELVRQLSGLRAPDGSALDLALTTNGVLLPRLAAPLAAAGLRRLTVSIDALDDAVFRRMVDTDSPVAGVLAGIDAAMAAGFAPLKLNMVVRRGVNEAEVVPLAAYARERGLVLRAIEYMDVGNSNGWRMDEVVPSSETIARVHAAFPLEPCEGEQPDAVSRRWRYLDGGGEFGTISSVTRAFCPGCTRARLSVEGQLFLCLFGRQGHDLRALLREGADEAAIAAAIAATWHGRDDRYSELRARGGGSPGRVEMSYIGG